MSLDVDARDLALELALAEVKRLREQLRHQPSLPGVPDTLVAEAAQAAVELQVTASRIEKRAPRAAADLRARAERLKRALPTRRAS